MFEIKGLDELTRNLDGAQKALKETEDDLGTVTFNPNDPASIEAAIQNAAMLIDERLGAYAANPIVGPLIEPMKEKFREGIIERAANARLEQANDK